MKTVFKITYISLSYYKYFNLYLACDRESYGYGCREKCGRCRDLNQCFHITGACLTGCDAGYEGSMCNASEYNTCVIDNETDR